MGGSGLRYWNLLQLRSSDFGQRTGHKGTYNALTAGITWKPRKWLFIRPELRFDHFYGGEPAFEDRHSLFTATQDVLIRW